MSFALDAERARARNLGVMNKLVKLVVTAIISTGVFTALGAPADDAATNAPAVSKIKLKVVRADSEETAGENGSATNAVDGDTNTFWHTQWQDAEPPCPHEIVIELIPPSAIAGFTYLPRQDESDHGDIKDYEFYVSDDDKNFGKPIKKGTFDDSKVKKTVTFDTRTCRYIKLRALSEVNGEAWTSAAEIGVIPAE